MIMHVDLDAFFCAVEERRRPHLRGRPFVVAGQSHERGVVATASYAARTYGIRAGTSTAKAVQLCPEIVVVKPDYPAYLAASQAVMGLLQEVSPLVEQASIDEAYVAIADHLDSATACAQHVQQRIAQELQLAVSCGVASNKIVAKVATDIAKTRCRRGEMPRAIYVVAPGQEAAFLAPLPVDALCGIGPKTTQKLHDMGIRSLGELGWVRESDVRVHFHARQAEQLIRWARGIDDTPLQRARPPKSLSHETTFLRDVHDRTLVVGTVLTLAQAVAQRLQRQQLRGWVVHCRIRWDIYAAVAKQARLTRATDQASEIFGQATRLLDGLWDGQRSMRCIGIGVAQLGAYPQQLGFWDAELVDDALVWAQAADEAIGDAEELLGRPLTTQRIGAHRPQRWSPSGGDAGMAD